MKEMKFKETCPESCPQQQNGDEKKEVNKVCGSDGNTYP